jgi:hypothetical protein
MEWVDEYKSIKGDEVHMCQVCSQTELVANPIQHDDDCPVGALAALVEEAKVRERDVLSLTPGGSEFVGSWDNCIGFIQERVRVAGKVVAERNRLRKMLEGQGGQR